MKSCILLVLCLLVLALPVAAATANFQANCASGIPTYCVFDPNRTPAGGTGTACPGSTVSGYILDFGDLHSTSLQPFSPPWGDHTYLNAIQTNVCLTIFCSNGTSAAKCHCFANNIGVNGCIRPGAGWTP